MKKMCLPGKKKFYMLPVCLLTLFTATVTRAQTPVLFFNPVISSGLVSPLDIVNAGDGTNRMFIVQQNGIIRYARGSVLNDTIFLNISRVISSGGERGLLSMAFHPQYKTNGYFFVYYTNLSGNPTIARYQVSANPNKADSLTRQVLLSVPHTEFANHNGGKLNFGSDGNLYTAFGDGGSAGDPHFNSQKGDTLLGKMIRINVDNFSAPPYYSIPNGNPYTTPGDNIRDEVWAFGLRNPFRWSFDRVTHDMWIGDVGQDRREEINFRPAASTGGVNYGWRCYEGNSSYNDSGCLAALNYVFPIFDYDHTAAGGPSVTGGIVYRGTAFPLLYGWYVCIDFYSRNGWLIHPNGASWNVKKQTGLPLNVAGFGEDENGELYAISLAGILYQVQANTVLALKLESFSAAAKNGSHEIKWKTVFEQNLQYFEIEFSNDGSNFLSAGKVAATNTGNVADYQFNHRTTGSGKIFYRLKMVDNTGRAEYSNVLVLDDKENLVLIAPTVIQNNRVTIQSNIPFSSVQVIDMNGRILKNKSLSQVTGMIYVDVAGLSKGVYTVRLLGNGPGVYRKIVIQ